MVSQRQDILRLPQKKENLVKQMLEEIFQIFLLFFLSTGKSLEILQNQSLIVIHFYNPTGPNGITPTAEDYKSGEDIF